MILGLLQENNIYRRALEKIANDKSPPWDRTDFQRIARETIALFPDHSGGNSGASEKSPSQALVNKDINSSGS